MFADEQMYSGTVFLTHCVVAVTNTLRSSNLSVKSMILANWWNRACCDSRCWRGVMSLEHSTLNTFGTVISANHRFSFHWTASRKSWFAKYLNIKWRYSHTHKLSIGAGADPGARQSARQVILVIHLVIGCTLLSAITTLYSLNVAVLTPVPKYTA